MTVDTAARTRLRTEVLIVLGLSLGQSAVYSVVQLAEKMTRGPLGQATSTLNQPQSTREYFDLMYQLLGIFFALVPVALVFFLLASGGVNGFRKFGFTFERPGSDSLRGLGLAALIGIPSLGLYAVGRALGITTSIIPSALDAYWWTVPVLILSAVRHGIVEEVIVVAYLLDRLPRFGLRMPAVILVSALLRGSYHLYQGFGPFVGNAVMGVVFAWVYTRTRRVMPLVIAHALLDIVAFVGFSLFGKAIGLG
ncbi:type II CAAX endopeptidase family protein [Paenarthrobacter sp. DKR-5]|uniref:CPBP family intramembrane glutamic endopeptidase n=1 Tax=Paenarthrobacter sp. DKR-5 TaxID=2835535 RepID=UPI0020296AFC